MTRFKKLIVLLLTICMILPMAVGCGGDKCNHDNVIVCDTCGEIVVGNEYFSNMVKSGLNTFGKGKSMKTEMEGSLEMAMPSEAVVEYEDVNGEYQIIEAPKISISFAAEMTSGFDKDGGLLASGSASINGKQITADGKTARQIVYSIKDVSFEDLKLNYTLKQETTYPTLSDAEKAINDYTYENSETINVDSSGGDTVVSILTQMLPRILDAYSDPIVPYISGIIDANKKDINTVLANTFDATCTLSKKDGNNVFTVTEIGAGIKKIPLLLESKVNVLVDEMLGKGTYDKLPEKIETLLNTKLSKVISELEKKGIKIDELAEVIDETLQIVMDDKNVSLESLTGVDLVGFIDNLDKEKTIKQILINYGVFENEQGLTVYLSELEDFLNEYKDKTGYDIINQLFKVEVGAEQKEIIVEATKVIADFIDKIIKANIVADSKGNFVSMEYGINFNGKDKETEALIDWLEDNINFQTNDNDVSEDEEMFNMVMNALSSAKASVTYKTSVVK